MSGGIVAPASVYIWLCVNSGVEAKPKEEEKKERRRKKSYLQVWWPLTQNVKYLALQCEHIAIKPRGKGGNQKSFLLVLLGT